MKTFKTVCSVLAILMMASIATAQTTITRGPVPVGSKVAYEVDTQTAPTAAQAQGFEARFYDGSTPLTALTGVTCVLATSPLVGWTCQSVLSQSNLDALNRVGVHTLSLSLFRADVGEGPKGVPFTLTTPASAPSGGRLLTP